MWKKLIPALLLAGCAQLPPPAGDIQAKKFESIADKSVIYVARQRVDSEEGRTLMLDDQATITTFAGTYYRWEVVPGTHRIAAAVSGSESLTLTTAPGKIYFVQHTVLADRRIGAIHVAALKAVSDEAGRNLVTRGELLR